MSLIGVISGSDRSVPDAPTIGTATNVGSGRAYNNGRADVTFTAPTYTGRLPITSYTVTSSPGGFTGTGAASPISVTGLQSATAYTFTVTATNSVGTSAASAASNSITATTVPQAPTIGTATAGNAQATVTFTGNATGGSAITTYTATSSPGGFTGTSATSPITVTGLTNGTAYTFTVTATNANGTSTASAASNSITPVAPIYWISQSTNTSGNNVRIRPDSTNTRNILLGNPNTPFYIAPISNQGVVSAGKSIPNTIMWQRGATHVDSSGNIYVSGYRSSDNLAIYTFKFNSSLVLQWQRQHAVGYYCYATSMTTDSSGNVYVWYMSATAVPPNVNYQSQLIQYDSNGNYNWGRRILNPGGGSAAYGESYSIYWDGTNVIITGAASYNYIDPDLFYYYYWLPVSTSGTVGTGYSISDFSIGTIQAFNGTRVYGGLGGQYQLASWNTNSTSWNYRLTSGSFYWTSVTVDSSNNAYFVGQTGGNNCAIVKVNSSGSIVWQRTITHATASMNGQQVHIGQGGQVMVGFSFSQTVGGVSTPMTYVSLNPDGSGTGTLVVNGVTFTYAASSVSFTTYGSTPTISSRSFSISGSIGSNTAASQTISDYTITSAVTGIS